MSPDVDVERLVFVTLDEFDRGRVKVVVPASGAIAALANRLDGIDSICPITIDWTNMPFSEVARCVALLL